MRPRARVAGGRAQPEDAEFMHMPRLLACLHTLCNSCVEDARARAQRRAADPAAAAGRVALECPTCAEPTALGTSPGRPPTDWATVRARCAGTSRRAPSRRAPSAPTSCEAVVWCGACGYGLCEEHSANHRPRAHGRAQSHRALRVRRVARRARRRAAARVLRVPRRGGAARVLHRVRRGGLPRLRGALGRAALGPRVRRPRNRRRARARGGRRGCPRSRARPPTRARTRSRRGSDGSTE